VSAHQVTNANKPEAHRGSEAPLLLMIKGSQMSASIPTFERFMILY